ncbi:unnamed protein product, partial [Musa textilis]
VDAHPKELIIGDASKGVQTRSSFKDFCAHAAFLSQVEPNQFERNKVWKLVPRPNDHLVIGTKWVFRNKQDEYG